MSLVCSILGLVVKGGSSLQEDVRRLDVHLLVATVGRLRDLLDEAWDEHPQYSEHQ